MSDSRDDFLSLCPVDACPRSAAPTNAVISSGSRKHSPATIPFHDEVVRGELCAFLPGYFQFIAETEVTIRSVVHFMPGMRVVVAVHPTDFPVYQK